MPTLETFHHTFNSRELNSLVSSLESTHSWRDVFLASWMKYPHPRRPDILASDIIKKDVDLENGIIRVTRLIQLKGFVPSWMQYLTKAGSVMYIVEESETDVKNRTYVMRSKNLTFSDVLRVEERCVYQPEAQFLSLPSPNNSNSSKKRSSTEIDDYDDQGLGTHFEQTSAGASPVKFVGPRIEQFVIETAKNNIAMGREIMEEAILKAKSTKFSDFL